MRSPSSVRIVKSSRSEAERSSKTPGRGRCSGSGARTLPRRPVAARGDLELDAPEPLGVGGGERKVEHHRLPRRRGRAPSSDEQEAHEGGDAVHASRILLRAPTRGARRRRAGPRPRGSALPCSGSAVCGFLGLLDQTRKSSPRMPTWKAAKPGITTWLSAIPSTRPSYGERTIVRSFEIGSVTAPSTSPAFTASPSSTLARAGYRRRPRAPSARGSRSPGAGRGAAGSRACPCAPAASSTPRTPSLDLVRLEAHGLARLVADGRDADVARRAAQRAGLTHVMHHHAAAEGLGQLERPRVGQVGAHLRDVRAVERARVQVHQRFAVDDHLLEEGVRDARGGAPGRRGPGKCRFRSRRSGR